MANDHPEKAVRITLDRTGLPVPDHDPIEVRKNNHKIRFEADFPFTVDIDGYSDVKHSSTPPYHAKTGPFPDERTHKYSITANGQTHDPDIVVKP